MPLPPPRRRRRGTCVSEGSAGGKTSILGTATPSLRPRVPPSRGDGCTAPSGVPPGPGKALGTTAPTLS
eukprot:5970547-Alexandrium_andersonii.AAC.1